MGLLKECLFQMHLICFYPHYFNSFFLRASLCLSFSTYEMNTAISVPGRSVSKDFKDIGII